MSDTRRPSIECTQHHASLRVTDVPAAIEFYTIRLGFTLAFGWGDPPEMAGVNLDQVQIFLEPGAPAVPSGPVYFLVGDADELYHYHVANGVEVLVPPADRDYGLRDYTVRDQDGNQLAFGHRLVSRTPALEIERVDVSVRLERRIAAIVADLAARKGMSIGECLEETLLHTFEPLGDGVASPHTTSDLRYIQELKTKHGVDYDCHASYRFIERGAGPAH